MIYRRAPIPDARHFLILFNVTLYIVLTKA